jgi:glycine betaine/proline transport system substrate-binding protein
VFTDIPAIAAYFQRAAMPLSEMDKLLLALNDTGASVESVADDFVARREEIWRPWVGAAAP